MDQPVTGSEAVILALLLIAQFVMWIYFREGGLRDQREYRKYLRMVKEGKSFKLDVAQP